MSDRFVCFDFGIRFGVFGVDVTGSSSRSVFLGRTGSSIASI